LFPEPTACCEPAARRQPAGWGQRCASSVVSASSPKGWVSMNCLVSV
jgi:hypothetical protein